jgi:hypothetical protein
MTDFDVVVVGAGIAGLYATYKVLKMAPTLNVLLLEKSDEVGGRLETANFYGVIVAGGAGVGRKHKDILLIDLLKELGLPFRDFTKNDGYAATIEPQCDVKRVFLDLKREYNRLPNRRHLTFKRFALPLLGETLYTHFLICSGYTDYEEEDAYDVFHYYGFDDNFKSWPGMGIVWRDLSSKLVEAIGNHRIKTGITVRRIQQVAGGNAGWILHLNGTRSLFAHKVVIATTIASLMKLVPEKASLYRHIYGQPFLRVYAKFNKASSPVMATVVPQTTIVPGSMHKVIPMNKEKGVYMIAYTDNAGAIYLKKKKGNTPENRHFFCRLLEKGLGIPYGTLGIQAILSFYWEIGTHFYGPLPLRFLNRTSFIKEAQTPFPHMRVVGEMVALNQGWVEGALDSVDKVITETWLKAK